MSGWIARIIQVILQIYIIRLLTSILNVDEYAAYTLLMALFGWIVLSDFGLTISLQNFISEMRAKKVSYEAFIGNAIYLLIIIGLLLLLLFFPLSVFLAPGYLVKFNFAINDKIIVFYMAISIMLITVLSSIIYKVYFAIHKGYISNMMPALATTVSFILIYFLGEKVIYTQNANSLFIAVLLSLIPQAVLPLLLMIRYIIKNHIRVKLDSRITRMMIKRGSHFWVFAIFGTLTLQVDYLIASQFLSSSSIILYHILSKLFALVFFIYNSILMALWPVISEHLHKNEWESVFQYIKFYIPLGFLFIVVSGGILVYIHPFLIKFLIKNTELHANFTIMILFTFYMMIRVWTDTFALILQSVNILKPFWKIVPIQAFLSIFLQIYLAKIYSIEGLLLGIIGSFLLTVSWYLPYKVKQQYKLKEFKCQT